MAAAKMKKRAVIIGGKEYVMPRKTSTMAYLNYLDARESITKTEKENGMYNKQQFLQMVDVIVEMYGNQFTPEDVLDAETGLTPDCIIMEFALMDKTMSDRVDARIEAYAKNFTNGK